MILTNHIIFRDKLQVQEKRISHIATYNLVVTRRSLLVMAIEDEL